MGFVKKGLVKWIVRWFWKNSSKATPTFVGDILIGIFRNLTPVQLHEILRHLGVLIIIVLILHHVYRKLRAIDLVKHFELEPLKKTWWVLLMLGVIRLITTYYWGEEKLSRFLLGLLYGFIKLFSKWFQGVYSDYWGQFPWERGGLLSQVKRWVFFFLGVRAIFLLFLISVTSKHRQFLQNSLKLAPSYFLNIENIDHTKKDFWFFRLFFWLAVVLVIKGIFGIIIIVVLFYYHNNSWPSLSENWSHFWEQHRNLAFRTYSLFYLVSILFSQGQALFICVIYLVVTNKGVGRFLLKKTRFKRK